MKRPFDGKIRIATPTLPASTKGKSALAAGVALVIAVIAVVLGRS